MKPSAASHSSVVSVVIPARNAAGKLKASLAALLASAGVTLEVILVDDASDDDTPDIARSAGCTVISLERQSGPGKCRNRGAAAATGDVIVFIDDDVLVHPETVARLCDTLAHRPEVSAVVGMLEADTPFTNPASRYFNLRKHYDYKVLKGPMTNLYTSVTAIRREVFVESGGFDEAYDRIAVEDAELGRRLVKQGHRIEVDKSARVVHKKYHSLRTLLRSDHTRASHFMKLLLRERLAGDIVTHKRFASFRLGSIITVVVAPATVALLPLAPVSPAVWPLALGGTAALVLANQGFLRYAKEVFGTGSLVPMSAILIMDSLAVSSGLVRGGIGYLFGGTY